MDIQQYKRQKMQEIGLNEEQIDLVETLQEIIDEIDYYESKFKQAEVSNSSTIDEYLYAKVQYQHAKEKLNNFNKK